MSVERVFKKLKNVTYDTEIVRSTLKVFDFEFEIEMVLLGHYCIPVNSDLSDVYGNVCRPPWPDLQRLPGAHGAHLQPAHAAVDLHF